MKFLVLGHGDHGKDTFAELLCDRFDLTFTSSSVAAMDAIWPALHLHLSKTDKDYQELMTTTFNTESLKLYAFEMRKHHREIWKELISLYNAHDRGALCKMILKITDVYVGMRCDLEYEASKHLFTQIFYVDACARKPAEPSMKIKFNPSTMIYVDNNGLKSNMIEFVNSTRMHGGKIICPD